MKQRYLTRLLPLIALFIIPIAQADIQSWRVGHNGLYDAANPPVDWKVNLLFEIPLETMSNGTPILVGGKLFYTAETALLICADSKTGETLWSRSNDLMELSNLGPEKRASVLAHQQRIHTQNKQYQRHRADVKRLERSIDKNPDNAAAKKNLKQKYGETEKMNKSLDALRKDKAFEKFISPPAHNTNGYSSYTPVSDGKRVYVAFGLGVIVAYDLAGKRLWSQFIEHPDHNWGGATMPQIIDGKLIIRFDDYWALDPATGEKLWNADSEVVFGTPTPFQVEGQTFLFTPRGEIFRASDGKRIHDGMVFLHKSRDWSIFNTPTKVGDTLYTVSGVEGDNGDAYAYKIPQDLDTFLKKGLELVWHTPVKKNRYYSSVLVREDLAYIVTRDNELTVLEASTGEIAYTHKIKGARGTAYPSMVAAGDKIYLGIDDGTLVVLKPGREFNELARNNLGPFRSTPLFTGNIAYLRTYESLQAVGSL
jgi:outer membrane protein assembly factor BamB